MSIDDHVISTLQMEYNVVRQDLRDLVDSMGKNLATAVAIVSGLVAVAFVKDCYELLYFIPTAMFFSGMIHMVLASHANFEGAYCSLIECRLKERLGRGNILMDWETRRVPGHPSLPFSLTQIGLYLVFMPAIGAFVYAAWLAYSWHARTIWVHAAELVFFGIYAFSCIYSNSRKGRDKLLQRYMNIENSHE